MVSIKKYLETLERSPLKIFEKFERSPLKIFEKTRTLSIKSIWKNSNVLQFPNS